MGSTTRTVLPDVNFTGQEDIREFLRDFEIFVSLNEWSDEKAGQYLAVYLKEEAKAFYHQQDDSVRKSYRAVKRALTERYEGGLALLKYKKDFSSRMRKDGEALHSYLSALRLAYARAYVPPPLDPLPDEPSEDEKALRKEQKASLDYYNKRKEEDILCQFINGLKPDLREILIRQDDLLKTPVETVLKRIANLEQERESSTQQVRAAKEPQNENFDEVLDKMVDRKVKEILKPGQLPITAGVWRGGKRGAQRRGPKPTDVCRTCNGVGHWARSCPTEIHFKRKRGWPRAPTPALNNTKGVNYPYKPLRDSAINTVRTGYSSRRHDYKVEAVVNNVKTTFLVDTGAEVSLISSSVPDLMVRESQVNPISITHQPIVVKGETEVSLSFGQWETTWNFLVIDNLAESVLGADFIDCHHKESWGIKDDKLWLDNIGIPLITTSKCNAVVLNNYAPVIARCTVELPARHQVFLPLCCKDKENRTGFFESTRAPGGVLFSKAVVTSKQKGDFWVKAVNLSQSPVTLYKNQRVGILTEVESVSEPLSLNGKRAPVAGGVSCSDKASVLNKLGVNLSESALHVEEKEKLESLLVSFADVFSEGKRDIGKCNVGVQHHIHVKPGTVPVKQQLRRIPFAYRDEVKVDLKAMLEDGVIEKSSSEWASPLVIVRKPSGDLRICVDYRKLNEATQVTSYPLPNITESLDRLADASYFTTIDMVSGYHQVEVAPKDRDKTAFITPFGLYQYCRMPFGLAGAPGTFQSVVEDMLQVLDADDVLAYLDDVICFHSSFSDHLRGIEKLLEAVRKAGFKLSGRKCQFAAKSVKFLGHVIDQNGIRPQPEKLDIIRQWATPTNETELRKFIGVCTFWRKFVKGFSQVAAPLHELLNKPDFCWTPQCEQAFNNLKQLLCTSVTLALPDRHGRFSVTCDASDQAVGYYLEQTNRKGDKRPVAFGGRKLSKAECNYSTTEKECLAVIQALKAYRPYILGQEFDLYTDHESLKWLLTRTQEHSGRLWRWVDKFREFQCRVHHIAGTKNTVADALSRIQSVTLGQDEWSLDFIKRQQESCPVIKEVKGWLSTEVPSEQEVQGKELKVFYKELSNLVLGEDGVLRRNREEGKETTQIVIPLEIRQNVLKMLHDEVGHFGANKTLHRVRDRYFWPFMASETEEWCKKCIICQQRRNPVPEHRAPLQPIVTTRPGELITMDIVEYPKSNRGSQYCLVMIDHFTKWLELFPLRNQKSETIAKKIVDSWIPRHGAPEQLHSDQGGNLNSKIIAEICQCLEMLKTRTTPFHPQSDGESERSIRTVNAMLSKVVSEDQKNWDLYISSTCLAYNTTVHSSTKHTPSYLEFGRELRLPKDLAEPCLSPEEAPDQSEFALKLRDRLQRAYKVARDSLSSAHRAQKSYYDRWAKAKTYKEGDLVLWFDKKTRKGRCMKLNRPWTGPWVVVKRLNDVVYRIRYRGEARRMRVKRRIVHHNQLKPFLGNPDRGERHDAVVQPRQPQQKDGRAISNHRITVIEDDNAGGLEDVILAEHPPAEDLPVEELEAGRPRRVRHPPVWMRDYDSGF